MNKRKRFDENTRKKAGEKKGKKEKKGQCVSLMKSAQVIYTTCNQ